MKSSHACILAAAAFGLGMAADRLLFDDASDGPVVDAPGSGGGQFAEGTLREAGASPGKDGDTGRERKPFSGGITDLVALVKLDGWEPDEDAVRDRLRGLGPEEVRNLVASLDSLDRNDPRSRAVRRAVLEKFAELDPTSAIAMVAKEPDEELRHHMVHRAFEALTRNDLEAAKVAYADLSSEELRHNALRAMAEGIGPENIGQLADFIAEQPDASHFSSILERWARRDPKAAIDYAMNLKDDVLTDRELKGHWLRSAAHGWAKTDPDAAVAWMVGLASDEERGKAAEGIFNSLNRIDPEKASTLMEHFPSNEHRRSFAYQIARNWAMQDVEAARAWANTLPPETGQNALVGLVHSWARSDPASAAVFLDSQQLTEPMLGAVHHLAREWAKSDLEAAAAWAIDRDPTQGRVQALDGIANRWAQQDPVGAADFALALEKPNERREALHTVGNTWARSDRGAAISWAEGLDVSDRGPASIPILERVAEMDVSYAVDLLGTFSAGMNNEQMERAEFPEIAANITERLAHQDPANAARYVAALPSESALQREATERLSEQWVRADPNQAAQWIGDLPSGDMRDVATRSLVDNIAGTDPEAAFQWANTVSNQDDRQEMMHHVLERWNEIDPAAARASLGTVEANPEVMDHLNEVFEK